MFYGAEIKEQKRVSTCPLEKEEGWSCSNKSRFAPVETESGTSNVLAQETSVRNRIIPKQLLQEVVKKLKKSGISANDGRT